MTKRELDCHLELQKQIKKERKLLAALEAAAGPRVQRLDGMPRSHDVSDPAGCLAAEIADMKETIARHEEDVARSAVAVSAYIKTIEDSQTRMIFRLRFLRGMAWKEVAAAIGGRNTENGVKATCYRYMAVQNRKENFRINRSPDAETR